MKTLVVASLLALAPMALLAANEGHRGGDRGDMFKKMDTNGDGVVTKDEVQAASADNMGKRFEALDLNHDGQLTQDELARGREQWRAAMKEKFAADFKAADKNGDGGLSKEEAAAMPRTARHFDELDANQDGIVTQEELQARHQHWKDKHPTPSAQS